VIANQYDLNEVQDYEERYAIIEPYIDALTQAARSPEPVKTEEEARPHGPPSEYRSIEFLKEEGTSDIRLSRNALDIYESLLKDKKIEAIKEVRHIANAGLKEAKEFVDNHWNSSSKMWKDPLVSLNGVLI